MIGWLLFGLIINWEPICVAGWLSSTDPDETGQKKIDWIFSLFLPPLLRVSCEPRTDLPFFCNIICEPIIEAGGREDPGGRIVM